MSLPSQSSCGGTLTAIHAEIEAVRVCLDKGHTRSAVDRLGDCVVDLLFVVAAQQRKIDAMTGGEQ